MGVLCHELPNRQVLDHPIIGNGHNFTAVTMIVAYCALSPAAAFCRATV
jgi:hypothetical protein